MKVNDGRFVLSESDPWASVTWEGAEWETIKRGAAMTFRERLEWLEQASEFFSAMRNAERARMPQETR